MTDRAKLVTDSHPYELLPQNRPKFLRFNTVVQCVCVGGEYLTPLHTIPYENSPHTLPPPPRWAVSCCVLTSSDWTKMAALTPTSLTIFPHFTTTSTLYRNDYSVELCSTSTYIACAGVFSPACHLGRGINQFR